MKFEVEMSSLDNTEILNQFESSISSLRIGDITSKYETLSYKALTADNEQLFSDLTVTFMTHLVDYDYSTEIIRYSIRYMTICEEKGWNKDDLTYCAVAATLYMTTSDFPKAITYVEREISIAKDLGREVTAAHCYGNLGWLYFITNNYNEALNILTDAVLIYERNRLDLASAKMKTLTNLSLVYLKLDQLDKAFKYMNIVLNWENIDKHQSIRQELYTAFGKYFTKCNNYEQALLYYCESIEIAEEGIANNVLLDLYNSALPLLIKEKRYTDVLTLQEKIMSVTKLILERNTQSNYRLFKNELDYVHHELDFLSDDNNLAANDLDTLTCAYNRDFLNKHVEHLFYASSSDNMPFSLMLIDLDDFNIINTKHGHHIGDKVLQAVAKNLNSHLVGDQELVRYAGDRFIITMANTTKVQAKADALNYLKMIKDQVYLKDQYDIQITASAGLVESMDSKAKNLSDLLRLCDLVLFQAKKSGKKQLSQW